MTGGLGRHPAPCLFRNGSVEIFANYDLATNVLAASIRSPRQVTDAALAGAQVATIPTKVFDQMLAHPLTDRGIEGFLADWKKSGR
jgi:transaldolase